MAVSVAITIADGRARALFRELVALGEEIGAPGGPLDAIGAAMIAATQRRFETGIGPDGQAWRPSARAVAQGGKTLVDTGRLMQSLSHLVAGDAVEWGTNVIYAAVHQFGKPIKPTKGERLTFLIPGVGWRSPKEVTMPARPFLGFATDGEDDDTVAAVLGDFITAATAKAASGTESAGGAGTAAP